MLVAPPRSVADLQNVNITLRVLFRPIPDRLPQIFTNLGIDYDERVLPSIVNEILKAIVVSVETLCSHNTSMTLANSSTSNMAFAFLKKNFCC